MLSFLIARDTMHQQQWLAVIEELGGPKALPIPNSFDQSQEKREFSYVYLGTAADGSAPPAGRFTAGPSLDGRGSFTARQNAPLGEVPVLGPARPDSGAQTEQISQGHDVALPELDGVVLPLLTLQTIRGGSR